MLAHLSQVPQQATSRTNALNCWASGTSSMQGQLKCDTPIRPRLSPEERESLRKSLFPGMRVKTLVLLGSSTWAGEEEFLVNFVKRGA